MLACFHIDGLHAHMSAAVHANGLQAYVFTLTC